MTNGEPGRPPKFTRKKSKIPGLGARIRAGMEQRGLTNVQVAVELGVDDSTVSNWKNGKREPEASQLLALAGMIGVTVEDLLGVQTDKARLWQAARIWLEATITVEALARDMARARDLLEPPPPFPLPVPEEEPELVGADRR